MRKKAVGQNPNPDGVVGALGTVFVVIVTLYFAFGDYQREGLLAGLLSLPFCIPAACYVLVAVCAPILFIYYLTKE